MLSAPTETRRGCGLNSALTAANWSSFCQLCSFYQSTRGIASDSFKKRQFISIEKSGRLASCPQDDLAGLNPIRTNLDRHGLKSKAARSVLFPARQNGLKVRRLFLGSDDADFDFLETGIFDLAELFQSPTAKNVATGAKLAAKILAKMQLIYTIIFAACVSGSQAVEPKSGWHPFNSVKPRPKETWKKSRLWLRCWPFSAS